MAKLNEFGEIEMDSDPYAELPPTTTRALVEFVLLSDWETAMKRLDALQAFLSEWRDIEDEPELEQAWIDDHKRRSYVVYLEGDGSFTQSRTALEHGSIPIELVDLLLEQVMSQGEVDQIARVAALEDIVGEWMALLTDDEKLLGHLIKVHGVGMEARDLDGGALFALHAELHEE